MDYLTPLAARTQSFKEFMQEWVIDQFVPALEEHGLRKPWYWDTFLESLDYYHHMVYASAYTYRASVWFNFVVPGPEERAWLRSKYPALLAGARSGLGRRSPPAGRRPIRATTSRCTARPS